MSERERESDWWEIPFGFVSWTELIALCNLSFLPFLFLFATLFFELMKEYKQWQIEIFFRLLGLQYNRRLLASAVKSYYSLLMDKKDWKCVWHNGHGQRHSKHISIWPMSLLPVVYPIKRRFCIFFIIRLLWSCFIEYTSYNLFFQLF